MIAVALDHAMRGTALLVTAALLIAVTLPVAIAPLAVPPRRTGHGQDDQAAHRPLAGGLHR